ncbi:hypothetical protein [Sphingobacterium sp. LRF_L2]|uniref:hypothetical protein n=1 Tax=Sphingobacterium sp. LRF_L2 TaxID=3369421 RepID=UPI003F5D8C5E
MLNKITQILAAKVCFAIFFIKMLIAATPIFIDVLDKGTILQVVLQLEIENNAKGNNPCEDHHETGSKFFSLSSSDYCFFCSILENNAKQRRYLKDEKSIRAYHPSVPTPPPNA